MFKAIAVVAFSFLTFTGALANAESLYTLPDVEVSITASVDQPTVEFMGDGIAAETAAFAAYIEQRFETPGGEMVAQVEADTALDPVVTGSLGLMAWEEEEPSLVQVYVASHAAHEAMLTP